MGLMDKIKEPPYKYIILALATALTLYGIYSTAATIKENRFNRLAENFIQENRYIGNSYIYNYETRHTAFKPSVMAIYVAGENLSQENISELHNKLAAIGLEPQQLEIDRAGTYLPDKTSDKEMLKGIFEQNEHEIQKREQLISSMQEQLKAYKKREFPTLQIAREIAAQYPQLLSLTLARGETADALLLGTDNANILSEKAIAIMKFSEPISASETSRLEKWLAIRLDVPELKIIVEQQ